MTRLSRPAARTICRLVALATVVWPGVVAAAEDPPASDVYLIVAGNEEVPAEFAEQLGDVLASPSLALVHRVLIAHVDRVEPAELFDLHRNEASHPTAWVIVDGATVHVRAAGAGRAQFVFRDITTSRPMSDLDRERVGQTLRTALSAVIEGRPGALGRAQAQQAIDVQEPRRSVPKPEAVEVAPPLALIPPESASAHGPHEGPMQFHLGASLQIVRLESQFAYAPGATGALELRQYSLRPRVWVSVMEFLPHAYHAPAPIYATSFRVGLGMTVPPVPWLQIDLGGGLDWLRAYSITDDLGSSAYRAAVRVGPTDRFGVLSSLTLSIERVTGTFTTVNTFPPNNGLPIEVSTDASLWRPGLTLELWWL